MHRLIIGVLAATITSCDARPAADDGAASGHAATSADNSSIAVNVTGTPRVTASKKSAALGPSRTIPAALRGSWGMTAEDCTSTRGDAKGRLEISDTQLGFYESRGTLRDIVEAEPGHIVADFNFTGEGQTWQRRVILDEQDGGRALTRRETGPDAMPASVRYQRCKA
jgi:hypothetical protein